jgi:hypothetical protein
MDKIIVRSKTNLVIARNNIRVKYRFINVKSLRTNESLNIGIIWETENHDFPEIKIINNLELFQEFFPIFDANHAKSCVNLIKIKFNLGQVQNTEVKITSTITISNIKTHKQFFENRTPSYLDIEKTLYKKYITLSKTENKINQFCHNTSGDLRKIIFNTFNIMQNFSNKSSSTLMLIEHIKLKEKLRNQDIFQELEKLKTLKAKTYENT